MITIRELKNILNQYDENLLVASNTWEGFYSMNTIVEYDEEDNIIAIIGLD